MAKRLHFNKRDKRKLQEEIDKLSAKDKKLQEMYDKYKTKFNIK